MNSVRSSANVIRPKSIATVVRAFTDLVSSVMSRSVPTIATSLIVLINVVLPAEKGPVTTTFSGRATTPFVALFLRTICPRGLMMYSASEAG